jgi:hypothetical protein
MKMRIYYKTDAVSGEMEADSLQIALDAIDERENITDTLEDGSWAWVEADGDRLYLGRENM